MTLLILLLGISFAIAFATKIKRAGNGKTGIIMYRDMPMSQRLDRIGELLAKGVYLYIQKQKEEDKKNETKQENNIAVDKNS